VSVGSDSEISALIICFLPQAPVVDMSGQGILSRIAELGQHPPSQVPTIRTAMTKPGTTLLKVMGTYIRIALSKTIAMTTRRSTAWWAICQQGSITFLKRRRTGTEPCTIAAWRRVGYRRVVIRRGKVGANRPIIVSNPGNQSNAPAPIENPGAIATMASKNITKPNERSCSIQPHVTLPVVASARNCSRTAVAGTKAGAPVAIDRDISAELPRTPQVLTFELRLTGC
jgi:hypothetical protein